MWLSLQSYLTSLADSFPITVRLLSSLKYVLGQQLPGVPGPSAEDILFIKNLDLKVSLKVDSERKDDKFEANENFEADFP